MKRKILALLLAATMAVSTRSVLSAGAAQTSSEGSQATSTEKSGDRLSHGDYEYEVLDDGTVSIEEYIGSETEITIPDKIDGKTVTKIGDQAFIYRRSITGVIIPDSVTEIEWRAFEDCDSLASVKLGKSLQEIGFRAFNGCEALTNIEIPKSLSKMYYNSFNDCVSLESFIVDKDNNYFSSVDGVLYNKDKTTLIRCPQTKKSISVIDSVTKIDEGACYGCESLENILLPDKLTEIGKDAFNNCQSLEEIHIPESVTEIGHRAFFGTAWLDNYPDDLVIVGDGVLYKCRDDAEGEITIPKTVKKIVDEAFYRCTALESITIPDSVTKIGFGAFSGCSALKSLIIPDSVTTLDYELTEDGILTDCTSLVSVTIGNSVTTIPPCTFGNCTSLKNLTLGNSVGEIKEIAFYDCTSLESITLPNSVTSIGTRAFEDCTSLKSIYISDSVTLIGEEAFFGCTSLANVIGGAGVSTIYGNSFAGTPVYENPSGDFIIAGDILVEYRGSEENVTIPEGVKSIPIYFKKDSPNSYSGGGSCLTVNDDLELRSVILPESLKTIGQYAFAYCYSLGDITIPDSVTLIEEDAFSGFRSRIFCT